MSVQGVEEARVARTLLKMCRGLAAFELAQRYVEPPTRFAALMHEMAEPQHLVAFEEESVPVAADEAFLPEVGSTAFNKHIVFPGSSGRPQVLIPGWQVVQEGTCRYEVRAEGSTTSVKLVLSEYLYVVAVWEAEGAVHSESSSDRRVAQP
jgi:hypothetical protein